MYKSKIYDVTYLCIRISTVITVLLAKAVLLVKLSAMNCPAVGAGRGIFYGGVVSTVNKPYPVC